MTKASALPYGFVPVLNQGRPPEGSKAKIVRPMVSILSSGWIRLRREAASAFFGEWKELAQCWRKAKLPYPEGQAKLYWSSSTEEIAVEFVRKPTPEAYTVIVNSRFGWPSMPAVIRCRNFFRGAGIPLHAEARKYPIRKQGDLYIISLEEE